MKANMHDSAGPHGRLVVVSHPAVLPVNQLPYAALVKDGWDAQLIVPERWRHEYSSAPFRSQALEELDDRFRRRPVLLPGRVQRHCYRTNPVTELRRLAPDVLFIEADGYSVSAAQWGLAAHWVGVPFGVQADENLDRSLPAPARLIRRLVLPRAAFVAARSPTAARLARSWGATGEVALVPHHVPDWPEIERTQTATFRVGFAGRLVAEKGIPTLLEAVARLEAPVELVVAGNGPLRERIQRADLGEASLRLLTDLHHSEMYRAYQQMDVLVLPSRTTPTWTEQFGRVLVEALSCGVPVVGSDSGEIPWVIETTAGGEVVPEGDAQALGAVLTRLRREPSRRRELATVGRSRAQEIFGVTGAAKSLAALLRHATQLPQDSLDHSD